MGAAPLCIERALGDPGQAANANLVADTGGQWTAAHRGQGCAYLAVRLKLRPEAFPSGAPSLRVFDGAANVRENIAGDVLASGTTVQWNAPAQGWNAGAVMADASLNLRQTIRVGAGVAFAQVGIVGFDGQIELEALRLLGLPEAAPAVLYACPSVPIGRRSLALETTWDLPSLTAGSTANIDVTVPGARRGDFADASLDTSSIAFVLDCHVWSNNSVRVTARNVSASTVDLVAAALSVQVTKRRLA